MAFEKLLGLLRTASQTVFGGEPAVKEAKRITENVLGMMDRSDEMKVIGIADHWMNTTGFSKQGKTGADQISLLVFSNDRENMELVARLLNNHHIYLAACSADREQQRPTQWITRMVKSESALVRDAAFGLIGEFDLEDVDAIREAMGIEPRKPEFVDSRDPD